MAARRLLADLAHAVRVFAEADEEGLVEVWGRTPVFRLDQPSVTPFAGLPCAERPPRAYLLWTRVDGGEKVWELLWAADGLTEDHWPVVEVSEGGDANVLAASASDYVDALLYSGGLVGGGSEEDLENARSDASAEAVRLGDEIAEELDRADVDLEALGERWEAAQERFGDRWFDAVEGE